MRNQRLAKHRKLPTKGFTLFETLLTLSVTSFVILLLSGSVKTAFRQVEESLFLMSFEALYQETQQVSLASQSENKLSLSNHDISKSKTHLSVPEGVSLEEEMTLTFSKGGGNSSLAKVVFHFPHRTVTYQLYLGSGKYRKTES